MLESGSRVLNPSSGNDLGKITQSSRFLMFSSVLSWDGVAVEKVMPVQGCGIDHKTTNSALDAAGAEYILLRLNLGRCSCPS